MDEPDPILSSILVIFLCMAAITGCVSLEQETNQTTPAEMTPTKAQGPGVSVTNEINDEDINYIESNDSVRYPDSATSAVGEEAPTQNVEYNTAPFERWAESEAAFLAAEQVRELVHRKSEADVNGVAYGIEHAENRFHIVVSLNTEVESDGEIVSTPTVEFEDIVEWAPESVESTVILEERRYQEEYPVKVKKARETQV